MLKTPVPAEAASKVEAFVESSALARSALLKLVEKWRRLQSGASRTKSPAYSAEE